MVSTYALTFCMGRDSDPACLMLHELKSGERLNEYAQAGHLESGLILTVSGNEDDIYRYVLARGFDCMNFFHWGGCDVLIPQKLYEERTLRERSRHNRMHMLESTAEKLDNFLQTKDMTLGHIELSSDVCLAENKIAKYCVVPFGEKEPYCLFCHKTPNM